MRQPKHRKKTSTRFLEGSSTTPAKTRNLLISMLSFVTPSRAFRSIKNRFNDGARCFRVPTDETWALRRVKQAVSSVPLPRRTARLRSEPRRPLKLQPQRLLRVFLFSSLHSVHTWGKCTLEYSRYNMRHVPKVPLFRGRDLPIRRAQDPPVEKKTRWS